MKNDINHDNTKIVFAAEDHEDLKIEYLIASSHKNTKHPSFESFDIFLETPEKAIMITIEYKEEGAPETNPEFQADYCYSYKEKNDKIVKFTLDSRVDIPDYPSYYSNCGGDDEYLKQLKILNTGLEEVKKFMIRKNLEQRNSASNPE
jgi:hypothetical protein